MKLRRLYTLVLFLLALTFTSRADDTTAAADNAPKLDFPKVEGWENSGDRPLPAESGGGYSVAYSSVKPRIVMTIYVFNRGLKKIDNNLSSPQVQEEFNTAKAAVQEAARRGIYKEAKEEESGPATLGDEKSGVKTLHARFHLVTKNNDSAISEIFVLPYHDYFIKLRVTRMGDDPKTSQAALDKLTVELAKTFSK